MNNTGIDWTDVTWNPVTGCDKVSSGCKNCYAEPLAERLQRMGNTRYKNGFELTLHWDKTREPMEEKKPQMVFVNSMSDLLHKDVPDTFIKECFDTMRACPHHTFQVLTKRSERWPSIEALVGGIPRNVWPGVSIEDARHMNRLQGLQPLKALKMVSFEPLLGSLGTPEQIRAAILDAGIGWVISGGESGWKARPAEMSWFREIRDACEGIPLFHKQHGGVGMSHEAKRSGDLATIDGVLHQTYPQRTTREPRQSSLF